MAKNIPHEPIETDAEFFELDRNNLDIEWEKQPKLYHRFAYKLANARQTLEEAKARMELVEASLGLDMRNNPEKYDLPKTADKTIEAAVLVHPKYQRAKKGWIEAKHRVDLLDAAVKTLDHRKKALENEVSLFLADYFSRPTVKGGSGQRVMDETSKQHARKKINRALNEDRETEDD